MEIGLLAGRFVCVPLPEISEHFRLPGRGSEVGKGIRREQGGEKQRVGEGTGE